MESPKASREVAKLTLPCHTTTDAGSTASGLHPETAAGSAAQAAPQHHLSRTDPALASSSHGTGSRAGVGAPAATHAGHASSQQEAAGSRNLPSPGPASQAAASSGSASGGTAGTSAALQSTGASVVPCHPPDPGRASPPQAAGYQGPSTKATLQMNGTGSKPSHDPGGSESSCAASQQSAAGQTTSDCTGSPGPGAALRPISAADFEVAMQRIRPSITRDFSVELTPGTLCTCQHFCSSMHALQTTWPGQPPES